MPTSDIVNLLKVTDVLFRPQFQQDNPTQASGQTRSVDIGEAVWTARVATAVLSKLAAHRLDGYVNKLGGSIGSFYLWNPRAPYPILDPKGLLLGASVVKLHAVATDTIALEGLPAGYQISVGDFFCFDHGSSPVHRAFHQFTDDAVADGSGVTGNIAIFPHIREGATTGLTVTLKKPAAEMVMQPDSYEPRSNRNRQTTFSFMAVQIP